MTLLELEPVTSRTSTRLGLALTALGLAAVGAASGSTDNLPWKRTVERLDHRLELLTAGLEEAHRELTARATVEDVALLERLSSEPPGARPWGYGILPEIDPSPELEPTEMKRQRFSLADLERWIERSHDRLQALSAETVAKEPLAPLVTRFDQLESEHGRQQKSLDYHRFWQQAVVDQAAFFAGRNRLLDRVRELRRLETDGRRGESGSLRREIARRVAPFHRTPGLEIRTTAAGERILAVAVATDIADPLFLQQLRQAVDSAFNDSPAARARRFRVELGFRAVDPASLYPEGVPGPGDRIERDDHLGRFPPDSLILTTGARSTHARTGRFVQLGPHPRSARTLAHEFAHLLGFDDAYLRAYDGSPDGPYGVTLIEWTGLQDDLMGAPDHGAVTPEMIDRLLEAYGAGPAGQEKEPVGAGPPARK